MQSSIVFKFCTEITSAVTFFSKYLGKAAKKTNFEKQG